MAEKSFLERRFKLSEHKTTVKTEVMAGITTFMTMSYILAVNPGMLSEAGMDQGAVFTATILASALGTILMALLANYPFALSAGMGLNAYFTYTVVLNMGHDWTYALTAVFIEGIIFILMSIFNIREAIFKAIPTTLKKGVSVGIGLFITLIGLVNAGIIIDNPATLISIGDLTAPPALVAIFGLLVIGVLLKKNVRGSLLIGILASTILAIILGVTNLPTKVFSLPPSLAPIAFKLQWSDIFTKEMFAVVFAFLFVDIFDTIGTLIGVATKADMLDENDDLPNLGPALLSDAIATTAGALLGTSTVTTFVESASGVADGGRTGLTSLTTAGLFLLSLFLFPIFAIIPASATAPALIIVGLFMMSPVKDINFDDYTESIPAFLTIAMMPFAYSVAEGIVWGITSFVILNLLTGKKEKVSILMILLAILFMVYKIFG
ncbi:NCS2 family permease [Neofamilia massiliensis]|uniref:NCS2 family permease n=1 Tax=Neofamilia massiliensis TaxID=1673724 RepID=UPI0006BB7432|nr:NCS2 family permease [Neofamilia massiliensis]